MSNPSQRKSSSCILFTKASGAGNDFVVIDNMQGNLQVNLAGLARAVCDRHFGIGGDGLLVLEPSSRADFTMKYYNADGSYGGMCGNGGRCAARYANIRGISGPEVTFEALEHVYRAQVNENTVVLAMKDPVDFREGISVRLEGIDVKASFLNTGSPHAVIEVQNLRTRNVERDGRILRFADEFAPEGANINFFQKSDGTCVHIRTYERGVEAETLACGTGSVATALVAAARLRLKSPVEVVVRSGETLRVHFEGDPRAPRAVRLEGSARMTFSGEAWYDEEAGTVGLRS